MRKILLLGTIFVATSALAFSGLVGGISGGPKSKSYSGGADAIGVHFNGKPTDSGEAENTDEHGCPEHSTYSEQYDQCFCEDGYYMFNQKCQPTYTTCTEQGGYWCINGEYSTCEKDEAACYALCPEDKKCNGTCCTYANTCHHEGDVYQCCNDEKGECCDAGESAGYGIESCLSLGAVCAPCGYGQPYSCDNFVIYKGFYSTERDHFAYKGNNERCYRFDELGNCTQLGNMPIENPLACYWKDSNGHCRVFTTKCPEGQLPYCGGPWKGVDEEGIPDCAGGPGYFCCSGEVTYGEGSTPDTCEE